MEDMNETKKIIEALEGVERAQPSSDLIQRMENLAVKYSNKVNSFSREAIIGIAASFLLLFAVNVYAVKKYNLNTDSFVQQEESEAYNLIPAKSIY